MAIAYLPDLEILKDRCVALFATLPLWLIPTVQRWRMQNQNYDTKQMPPPTRMAA